MNASGALYIVKFLESQGIGLVAGIPGGSILPLYDALARCETVRHVLARHEQGAAFIAQGMARLTGRPGVCLATSGPGATNLVTAIADARRDGVPLVLVTGQVPSALLGTEAFQEVDIVAVTKPIAKSSRQIRRAEDLPEALAGAFHLAAEGRPGPVLLDVPRDVQLASFDWPPLPALIKPGTAAPAAWDVSRAAAMINAANRPVLLLGGGAAKGEAALLAARLARKAVIPVTMTLMGLGALPHGDPLNLGMHGMHGHARANHALEECDLLIALGSRFDDRATGDPSTFCPDARIIHVNLDASELGRIKRVDLGIAAGAAATLEAVLPLVERRVRRDRGAWLDRIEGFKRRTVSAAPGEPGARRADSAVLRESSGRPTARDVIERVARRISPDAVIVTDVGQHQMFVAQSYPFTRPGRFITSGGFGVMGFGLPAAIGAALAEPGAQVVLITGDGSLKMNVQELATLAETGSNVKIVVLDNQSLGLVVQLQQVFFGGRESATRFERGTDFAALAEAFGVPGLDLDKAADKDKALEEALGRPGPALIHARVDQAAMVFPMVPPGAANTRMLGLALEEQPAADEDALLAANMD
jgi:acetolactate synthase-1/2/3 large subunit